MIAAVLASVVGIGILMAFSSILNGYALSVLWGWFVVPTFSVPALGIVPAIGIAMMVSYLTYQTHNCKKEERGSDKKLSEGIMTVVLKPLLALLLGWIIHLFM